MQFLELSQHGKVNSQMVKRIKESKILYINFSCSLFSWSRKIATLPMNVFPWRSFHFHWKQKRYIYIFVKLESDIIGLIVEWIRSIDSFKYSCNVIMGARYGLGLNWPMFGLTQLHRILKYLKIKRIFNKSSCRLAQY